MGVKLFSVGNCTTNILGSGLPTCLKDMFGDLQGIDLYQKGVGYTVDAQGVSTLDEASYTALIKEMKLFPFNFIYNFEQTTPENERSTSSTGILSTIRLGKPQYSVSFDKGTCNHKNLFDKRGSGRWDIGLKFDSGYLLFTNVQKTKLNGANCGLFDVDTFMLQAGTDPQMSRAFFQFIDTLEFNTQMVFFPYETLGFNASQKNGVINTNIVIDPVINGATSVTFKVVSSCNADDVIASLDQATNWSVSVNGTAKTLGTITFNATTGKYTQAFTGAVATGEVLTVETKSGSTKVAEDANGNLFKGVASKTVTAS